MLVCKLDAGKLGRLNLRGKDYQKNTSRIKSLPVLFSSETQLLCGWSPDITSEGERCSVLKMCINLTLFFLHPPTTPAQLPIPII